MFGRLAEQLVEEMPLNEMHEAKDPYEDANCIDFAIARWMMDVFKPDTFR